MSRVRKVKGNYAKVTKEDHNMYSVNDSISFSASEKINTKGEEGGVQYSNAPKEPILLAKDITKIVWLDNEGKQEKSYAKRGEYLCLKVFTVNYKEGDLIKLQVHDSESDDDIHLIGRVEEDGTAILTQLFYTSVL